MSIILINHLKLRRFTEEENWSCRKETVPRDLVISPAIYPVKNCLIKVWQIIICISSGFQRPRGVALSVALAVAQCSLFIELEDTGGAGQIENRWQPHPRCRMHRKCCNYRMLMTWRYHGYSFFKFRRNGIGINYTLQKSFHEALKEIEKTKNHFCILLSFVTKNHPHWNKCCTHGGSKFFLNWSP